MWFSPAGIYGTASGALPPFSDSLIDTMTPWYTLTRSQATTQKRDKKTAPRYGVRNEF
jgi:hypothetical protein